ncbi:MAG: GDP-L-fucose synthase [Candidatus Solibacter usitatus]|nr:GDP-L-fucose synthase [Candidatus Solibacter usitatus]
MLKDSRIYVAGHTGLAGSAIMRKLSSENYGNVICRTRAELDLTNQLAVEQFFAAFRPEYVFLSAARVGGILANSTRPAEFIRENLLIQTHVIDAAYRHGCGKLLFLGSSCAYPRDAPQPVQEEHFMTGPLEATNTAYAIAKIAGIQMAQAYRQQYGFDAISLMPTNLYGPGDRYDLQSSHVLAALMGKFHAAKVSGAREVVLWGSGQPMREFLHADDLADAAVFLMQHYSSAEIVNVGTGKDISVMDLALLIREVVGSKAQIVHDLSKPDGTPRKLLDISRLTALGWKASVGLRAGIERTYRAFLKDRT